MSLAIWPDPGFHATWIPKRVGGTPLLDRPKRPGFRGLRVFLLGCLHFLCSSGESLTLRKFHGSDDKPLLNQPTAFLCASIKDVRADWAPDPAKVRLANLGLVSPLLDNPDRLDPAKASRQNAGAFFASQATGSKDVCPNGRLLKAALKPVRLRNGCAAAPAASSLQRLYAPRKLP